MNGTGRPGGVRGTGFAIDTGRRGRRHEDGSRGFVVRDRRSGARALAEPRRARLLRLLVRRRGLRRLAGFAVGVVVPAAAGWSPVLDYVHPFQPGRFLFSCLLLVAIGGVGGMYLAAPWPAGLSVAPRRPVRRPRR